MKDSGKCRYIDGTEEDLVQKTTYIMLDQESFESAADPTHQRCWQQLYVLCAIVRHCCDCRASLMSTVNTQTYLLTYDKQWKVSVTRSNGRNTSVYPRRRRPPCEVGVSSLSSAQSRPPSPIPSPRSLEVARTDHLGAKNSTNNFSPCDREP